MSNSAIGTADKTPDAVKDIFVGLRSPTVYGQPNWNAIFRAITRLHSPAKRGVFHCGSPELWGDLLVMCRRYPQEGLVVESSGQTF